MAVTYTSELTNATPRSINAFDVIPFSVEVPADAFDSANDSVLLLQFGPNTVLPVGLFGTSCAVVWTDDLDSNGTPTLDLHFGVGDSDGTLDTELITGSAIGQAATAAAGDELDATGVTLANGGLIDVSGKYFIAQAQSAAATGAAGTVKGLLVVCNNAVVKTDDLT